MSYIAFHTRQTTGYISGAERAHLGQVLRECAGQQRREAFGVDYVERPSLLRRAVDWPDDIKATGSRFGRDADVCLAVDWDRRIVLPSGTTMERILDVNMNSVIATGSIPAQLLTRIYGQCEVHGYVEGCDRGWFAHRIEDSVRAGVFRDESWSRYPQRDGSPNGWQAVADLARSDASGPIVMSYSVTAQFPNLDIALWPDSMPDQDEDPDGFARAENEWCALTDGDQWDRAVAGLRRKTEAASLLRIAPDNLARPEFAIETPLTWATIAQQWEAATTPAASAV